VQLLGVQIVVNDGSWLEPDSELLPLAPRVTPHEQIEQRRYLCDADRGGDREEK
jgi:hypothetical protein